MKSMQSARSQWRAAEKKANLDESVRWEIWGGEVQEIHDYFPCESMRRSAARLMGRVR